MNAGSIERQLANAPTDGSASVEGFDCIVVGNGALARGCLDYLREGPHRVNALVTNDLALASYAESVGIRWEALSDPSGRSWRLEPVDYLFSIANLQVLGAPALALGRRGAINFHDAPLPGYVGLNCPAWAIYNGEERYGVTWHMMVEEVDAGAVLLTESVPIDPTDTAYSLNAKCYEAGLRTFRDLMTRLGEGGLEPRPQAGPSHKRYGRADRPLAGGWLDPGQPARVLEAMARALDFGPEPNPLALPTVVGPGGALLVGEVSAVDSGEPGEIGQIVGVGDSLRVRTAEGDALLREFRGFDGRSFTPLQALEELGAKLGSQVLQPTDAALGAYRMAGRKWLVKEEWWAERLRTCEPLEPSYLSAGSGTGRSDHPATSPNPASPIRVELPWVAEMARQAGVDPSTAAVSLVGLLLLRLADKDSIYVPFTHGGLQETAGAALHRFSAAVPLRLHLERDESYSAFAARLADELDTVTRNGSFSRDLVRRFPGIDDPSWGRQEWPIVITLAGEADTPWLATQMKIAVGLDGTSCSLFGGDATDPRQVAAFAARLEALGAALAAGRSVTRATVLSPADFEELEQINSTVLQVGPSDGDGSTIHRSILEQARLTPDRTAVVAGGRSVSYSALVRRALGLAHELRRRGVQPGDRVGIMCDRTEALPTALLAILAAGAAYVPLDPDFPDSRLEFMVEDADLALVLCDSAKARKVPPSAATRFVMDAFKGEADAPPADGIGSDDLAYVIYTSGSTGRPKGVMLEHRNVMNFFAAMDEKLGHEDAPDEIAKPQTWLGVTSVSFDISVLELLWTLARGHTLVLHASRPSDDSGEPARRGVKSEKPIDLSLFYFSADAGEDPQDKYRLLLEGARFADEHGFSAVWTPERHFHAFGGLYPNPSVTGAAVAAITERVRIRSGSCVLPLHSPIRIAEEWAVVDNISGGRVDISFASGWQPNDFVLAPEAYEDRHNVMSTGIETVRALWRGEARTFAGPAGREVSVSTLPRPVQPELPVWITAAGNPQTFRAAGEMGAGLLTHLLGQTLEELAEKVGLYRQAWREAGHPGEGHVSLMLHTFIAGSSEEARAAVWQPLREYLRTSTHLMQQHASTFPAFRNVDASNRAAVDERFRALSADEIEALLDHSCERYYETSGLFGTVEEGAEMAKKVRSAGVDEIACLIDFGIPTEETLVGLQHLSLLLKRLEAGGSEDGSIPGLIDQHGVTHLQCTPSLAQMLVSEEQGQAALRRLEVLLVGGEALPKQLAHTLVSSVPRVMNMYGPTETTIWSTCAEITPSSLVGSATAPIGRPIANTQVYVCDRNLQLLPPGVPGELVIGGDGVARGYWRRQEVTDSVFVAADLASGDDARRKVYRTGDQVTMRGGSLLFEGRLDFQVKIRGHRIELGEIEAVLDRHPSVARSVVVAQQTEVGDSRLVAYVQTLSGASVSNEELRQRVSADLPAIMVPSFVVQVDEFPLTPNGKVDRLSLPAPRTSDAGDGYLPPRTELEKQIAGVWCRVLSVERVGVKDDFFALGGNSLLAVFLISELAGLGAGTTLGQLLKTPTVEGLAAAMAQGSPGSTHAQGRRGMA